MYTRYVIALMTLLLGTWGCTEETFIDPVSFASVRGQVLLNATRKPVKGVLVRISPGGRITETDTTGNFRFDSLLAGKYTLTATYAPYRTEVASVEAATPLVSQVTLLLVTDNSQNRPPSIPTATKPASATTGLPTSLMLKWASTDPGRDTLRYDVQLFREGSTTPTQSFTNILADSVAVNDLTYGATYLWQVTVRDGVNTVNSPLFSFRTGSFPDLPYLFTRRLGGQLQLVASAGAVDTEVQLTTSGNSWRPVSSPDRKQIAFLSNLDGELHLYLINPDGSNRRRVTTVPVSGLATLDLSFCWSPDGTQLLYPANNRLYAVNADGTGLRTVATAPAGRLFAGCSWNGPTNRIAARTTAGFYDNAISLIPAAGGAGQVVLSRPDNRVGNPVFSADGRQLVFTIDVGTLQNEQGRQLDARLHRLNLADNTLTEIMPTNAGNNSLNTKPGGTNDLDPQVDPTGSRLLFTNTDNTGSGPRSIVALDLDGRNRTVLITNGEFPYWR